MRTLFVFMCKKILVFMRFTQINFAGSYLRVSIVLFKVISINFCVLVMLCLLCGVEAFACVSKQS